MANPLMRITKEIAEIQKGRDLSLFVAFRESNVRHIRALIVGPPGTPYEFGFFEFTIKIPKDYPYTSPDVKAITTNTGRTRFNPNIYSEGKVCLSILGTWQGEPGEQWSTAQGLESVLVSIQSLMSSNPYENEPGFEGTKPEDKEATDYAAKIRHETLRISVVNRLEKLLGIHHEPIRPTSPRARNADGSPLPKQAKVPISLGQAASASLKGDSSAAHEYDAEGVYQRNVHADFDPFAHLFKHRFLWYYDSYMKTVEEEGVKVRESQAFSRASFEATGNQMSGAFNYPQLKTRLEKIRVALDAEKDSWAAEGRTAVEEGRGLAATMKGKFEQLRNYFNNPEDGDPSVELSLEDKTNPFVWNIMVMGCANTDFANHVVNVRMHISPRFPEQQPRVVVVPASLFHHRVSKTGGVLCYFPEKKEDLKSHIVAVVSALLEENSAFDPRTTVNPEAAELRWGGEEGLKKYRRRLRRSLEDSWDC